MYARQHIKWPSYLLCAVSSSLSSSPSSPSSSFSFAFLSAGSVVLHLFLFLCGLVAPPGTLYHPAGDAATFRRNGFFRDAPLPPEFVYFSALFFCLAILIMIVSRFDDVDAIGNFIYYFGAALHFWMGIEAHSHEMGIRWCDTERSSIRSKN